MSIEELVSAGIPLKGGDDLTLLEAETALEWMANNTTLAIEKGNVESVSALPSCAKLFVVKFVEAVNMKMGVASQSIEGMSQSFRDGDRTAILWQLARSLLGGYLKNNQVRVFPARRRW